MIKQLATFSFERLEEKGSQEPSEVETTPFGGGTRLVCPSFFLPSILLAVGKTGQDDNEREDYFTVCLRPVLP